MFVDGKNLENETKGKNDMMCYSSRGIFFFFLMLLLYYFLLYIGIHGPFSWFIHCTF